MYPINLLFLKYVSTQTHFIQIQMRTDNMVVIGDEEMSMMFKKLRLTGVHFESGDCYMVLNRSKYYHINRCPVNRLTGDEYVMNRLTMLT